MKSNIKISEIIDDQDPILTKIYEILKIYHKYAKKPIVDFPTSFFDTDYYVFKAYIDAYRVTFDLHVEYYSEQLDYTQGASFDLDSDELKNELSYFEEIFKKEKEDKDKRDQKVKEENLKYELERYEELKVKLTKAGLIKSE